MLGKKRCVAAANADHFSMLFFNGATILPFDGKNCRGAKAWSESIFSL